MPNSNYQTQFLQEIKKYLKKSEKKKIDISKSVLCNFASWDQTPGYLNIKSKLKKNLFNFIRVYIKYLIGIGNQKNYTIINDKNYSKYNKIVLTWGYLDSFKNGLYSDAYLNLNSNDIKNSLWIVVYMDNIIPNKINENVILIKNESYNYSIIYLIKTFYKIISENKFNIFKSLHYSSSSSNFGRIILKLTKKYINKKISKVIMPYESQSFQNMFIKRIKKKNLNTKVFGYIHDFEPLTTNLVYTKNSPDILLLPNKFRKKTFNKYLGWPIKNIITCPSFRYFKQSFDEKFVNKILLPSGIHDNKIIIENFKHLIKRHRNLNLNKLQVREHPNSTDTKKQKKLKLELNNLISKYKLNLSNKTKNSNYIIVVGITSLVILALQKNYKVIQICMDPEIQTYTKLFWPSLKVTKINNFIFEYSLRKKERLFQYGKKKIALDYFK